jgi:hypothetical protein
VYKQMGCPQHGNVDVRGWKRHIEAKHGGVDPLAAPNNVIAFEQRGDLNNYKQGYKDGIKEGMKLAREAA